MTLDSSSTDAPHGDSNPLLDTVDLPCPCCGGIVNVQADEISQSAWCEDCQTPFWVRYNSGTSRFTLTLDPENPNETQGDLRYHERN